MRAGERRALLPHRRRRSARSVRSTTRRRACTLTAAGAGVHRDATRRRTRRRRATRHAGAPGRLRQLRRFLGRSGQRPSAGRRLSSKLGLFGTQRRAGEQRRDAPLRRPRCRGVRLDTTWTVDFPGPAGDAACRRLVSPRPARGAARCASAACSTAPTSAPSRRWSRRRCSQASGEAVVPSTVDVFVNGRPVSSEQVPPGPFTDRATCRRSAAPASCRWSSPTQLGRQQVI
ncbi:MAG: hypothetical protein MZV70_33795 [Desulfobacterales bacterium]|nr:hypothetical protein [Desulfobacterales bacterium]